ncbi:tyrosine-type recombinase/integrase (plasmid) [Rhodococcus sp. ZPP]|uniref:tyrosine-type recombinase/integrase n=1 Tax=Rhodococcus sp. ZPP TaxID=2749906 RepID=UPI001AD86C8B|nr:tyrosine-type recombinase/integrase [Rhodococcus sp. ZPP]QTJ71425.1 tyrosine-type recombinase/integrase [Rhodococcus sp. ZPP]
MPPRIELPEHHPLAGPIGEFLTDQTNAGRSPHTVRGYRGDLAQLARHHNGPLAAIDTAVLRGFFTAHAGKAPATRARKRAAVGEFLTWARRHGLLESDPMALIEHISVPERLPRPAPPGEVERVLDMIPKANLRDRVLFGLIHSTGLRAAEALGAYVEDLNLTADDEHLTVTAKGGRQRTVLLDDPALLALLRRHLRHTGYTRGPLFRAAKNHVGGPLRYASAEELWRKYCTAAEVKIGLCQLRHGHATELINAGFPVETVRKRLGHKKLSTTLLYASKSDRVADDEIRAWRRHRVAHPTSPPIIKSPTPEPGSHAGRARCPHCGRTPTSRDDTRQQIADLAITWLEPGATGTLTPTQHCAGCAPTGSVTDLACATCGDGPLLAGPDHPFEADTLRDQARTWLHDNGWQTEPELACPIHTTTAHHHTPHHR